MIRKLLGLALLSAAITAVYAASVPHTFQPNQPARAAEVNANFAALVNAVTTLEGKVAALENPPAPTMASIAGIYKYDSLEVGVGGGATGGGGTQAKVTGGRFSGTITLNANLSVSGTLNGNETNARVNSVDANTNHFHTLPGCGTTCGATATASLPTPVPTSTQVSADRDPAIEPVSATWTVNGAGEVVVTSTSDGTIITLLPASPKMLIGVSREAGASAGESDFYILNVLIKQ